MINRSGSIPLHIPWDGFIFNKECTKELQPNSKSLKAVGYIWRPSWGISLVKFSRLSSMPRWKQNKNQPSHRDSADSGRRTKTVGSGEERQKQCCDETGKRKIYG